MRKIQIKLEFMSFVETQKPKLHSNYSKILEAIH